jgi:hypothetical protein
MFSRLAASWRSASTSIDFGVFGSRAILFSGDLVCMERKRDCLQGREIELARRMIDVEADDLSFGVEIDIEPGRDFAVSAPGSGFISI